MIEILVSNHVFRVKEYNCIRANILNFQDGCYIKNVSINISASS